MCIRLFVRTALMSLDRLSRCFAGIALLLGGLCPGSAAPSQNPGSTLPPPATRKIDFAKDIQPIFADRCYHCHGPDKHEAQFRLDAKDVALKGGELGPAIIPGKSANSLQIQPVGGLQADPVIPRKCEG